MTTTSRTFPERTGVLTLLSTQTLAADTDTVSFGNLNGNVDTAYVMRGRFVNGDAQAGSARLGLNSATEGAGLQHAGFNVNLSTGGVNAPCTYFIFANNACQCMFDITINAKTGFNREAMCEWVQSDDGVTHLRRGSTSVLWADSSANLTTIKLLAQGGLTLFFKTGGVFSLYKLTE